MPSSPPSNSDAPLRMLLFDSWYDQYRGVICLMAITDGEIARGMYVVECEVDMWNICRVYLHVQVMSSDPHTRGCSMKYQN